MKRQSPYPANNAHQLLDEMPAQTQRMHQGSGMMNTPLMGPAHDHHYYASDARYRSNTAGNHLHRGQQILDSTTVVQSEGRVGNKPEPQQELDMEIGYEDNPAPAPTPLDFQALEKKFQDETLNLFKEQVVAEDAEIVRYKEKIIEISNQYQEKLSTLRAQQAKQREEFLQKESEARIQSYQQQSVTSYVPSKVRVNDDVPEGNASHLAREVGPIDNRSYIHGHGYIPEATTSHLAREVGPVDNRSYIDGHGYIPEAITGNLARKVARVDGRIYVPAEHDDPDHYRGYSTVRFHDQPLDRHASHLVDQNQRASRRVPMPYGRVYNSRGVI